MGKASKWFKAFLGFKKTDSSSSSSLHKNPSPNPSITTKKKRTNFKSYRDDDFQQPHYDQYGVSTSVRGRNDVGVTETNSRFKFVDPTNSSVTVEEVVELTATSGGAKAATLWNGVVFGREEWAAVVIQSQFRAYLRNSSNNMGCRIDKKQGSFARTGSNDDIGKILEINSGKSYITSTHRSLFYSSDLSLNSDQLSYSMDETCFSSADNSPQLHSTSSKCARSRRGPFTPTKSTDSTRSYSNGYSSNHPNYMSYTEAAKAKTRSVSAPKLRPQYDKRYSRNLQKGSNFDTKFTSKGVYPGSGRLDRHGMSVRGDTDEFSRGFLHIY